MCVTHVGGVSALASVGRLFSEMMEWQPAQLRPSLARVYGRSPIYRWWTCANTSPYSHRVQCTPMRR